MLAVAIGVCLSQIYVNLFDKDVSYMEKQFDGCWAKIKSGEDRGDWVCVNVKGMDYKRAVEVCQHEVGHEIFAEICEKDINKCFEVINNLE